MKKQIVGCCVFVLLGCGGVTSWEKTQSQAQGAESSTEEIAWVKVVDVARGFDSTCAVTELGELRCFGLNRSGSIGLPTTTKSLTTPSRMVTTGNTGEEFSIAAAPSREHGCASTTLGGVICWGRGDRGQLGRGFTNALEAPSYVLGINERVVQVINLFLTSCALTIEGDVYCWGSNNRGLLGFPAGPWEERGSPVKVGNSKYTRLAGMGFTACGITAPSLENGGVSSVECWGDNTWGQTGLLDGQTYVHVPRAVPNLTHVTDLSGDIGGFCGVTEAGVAVCWGVNNGGMLTGVADDRRDILPPTEVSLPVAGLQMKKISVGRDLNCAITTADDVYCWGHAKAMQDSIPNENKTVGPSLMFAPKNTSGDQLPLKAWTISTNFGSTCAVTLDKELVCWGLEGDGRLGNGATANKNNRTPFFVQFGLLP